MWIATVKKQHSDGTFTVSYDPGYHEAVECRAMMTISRVPNIENVARPDIGVRVGDTVLVEMISGVRPAPYFTHVILGLVGTG